MQLLLRNIKSGLPALEALLRDCSSHWGYEDPVYRFYHQSFKVYPTWEELEARRPRHKIADFTQRPGHLPCFNRRMSSTTARARYQYTYEEYLAYERDSRLKHEYDDGEIFAMAGGPVRHNALASRVSAALESARPPGCIALQSDQRIRILATGRTTYPDASVVCGVIDRDPADPSGTTITNPLLLVEVLSPSTKKEDRGKKWNDYQQIPSLQEYVLVGQSSVRVEQYRRLPSGTWEYSVATEGRITLSTSATLDLAWLYAALPD